jgi:pyridoxine 5-phosphate synthase
VGADAVEFHTGKWVLLKGKSKKSEWNRLKNAAVLAQELGLRVHAGHGLDTEHVKLIKKLPFLVEVNIGHFIVCDSLKEGLFESVTKIKRILKNRSSR